MERCERACSPFLQENPDELDEIAFAGDDDGDPGRPRAARLDHWLQQARRRACEAGCSDVSGSSSGRSGVCPGSDQPEGLFLRAMLTAVVFEFTRPMNSSISLGGSPAAWIVVGF